MPGGLWDDPWIKDFPILPKRGKHFVGRLGPLGIGIPQFVGVRVFSQKHRRCLGSRLGDYGRSERECPDPVDGRWTGCGRAGAAEIAWEEARDGGARANVRIRWTGGGRAVDGQELQK